MTPQKALEVMGLGRGATKADLKSAYRRLAAKCHPDLNPDLKNATELFKQLNAANQLLKPLLPEGKPKVEPKAKPQPQPEAQPPQKTQPVATVRATEVAPTPPPLRPRANPYAWLHQPDKGQRVDVYC